MIKSIYNSVKRRDMENVIGLLSLVLQEVAIRASEETQDEIRENFIRTIIQGDIG